MPKPTSSRPLVLVLLVLASLLASFCVAADPKPLPGGCGTTSPCGFGGECTEIPGNPVQHTCRCFQPFVGDDCSRFELNPPILIGATSIQRTLRQGSWDYFVIELPQNAPNYVDDTKITMQTIQGSCGFAIVDGAIQFVKNWQPEGYLPVPPAERIYSNITHLYATTSLKNVAKTLLTLSVVGLPTTSTSNSGPNNADQDCVYSGSFEINTNLDTICTHGTYVSGTCLCKQYWTGPNCDKFSFALIYTMAIAAGTFIIGALASSLIAWCLFKSRSANPNGSSQGYERYQ